MNEFVNNCKYLKPELISGLLFARFGTFGNLKALYVLERLMKTYDGYTNYVRRHENQILSLSSRCETSTKMVTVILKLAHGERPDYYVPQGVPLETKPTPVNIFDIAP